MAWDFSQRRASRWCLFRLDAIGAEFAADPDTLAAHLDDPWTDPDAPVTCMAGDTDADGLCPLHAGLPYQNMTAAAWEHVRLAITARRQALAAQGRAWDEVRRVKVAAREGQVGRWNALVAKIGAGGPVAWKSVTVADKNRLAQDPNLPDWAALDLLAACAPSDPDRTGVLWSRMEPWEWSSPSREQRSCDPRADVRLALAGNRGRGPQVVDVLLGDPNPAVRVTATRSQRLPSEPEEFWRLAVDPWTRVAALANGTAAPETVAAAAGMVANAQKEPPPGGWRTSGGPCHQAFSDLVLAGDHALREQVAEALSRNRALDWVSLRALARTGYLGYRALALMASHPNANERVWEELAGSKSKTVQAAAREAAAAVAP